MNIILIGFMGVGKTAVGLILAEKLGWKFVDMDQQIEKKAQMTVAEIFNHHGENHFRRLESEELKSMAKIDSTVIATGGGVVLNAQNMKQLKKLGHIISLTASAETILARVEENSARPLLQKKNKLDEIKKLLSGRRVFYEKGSAIIIDTERKTPEAITELIIKKIDVQGMNASPARGPLPGFGQRPMP